MVIGFFGHPSPGPNSHLILILGTMEDILLLGVKELITFSYYVPSLIRVPVF